MYFRHMGACLQTVSTAFAETPKLTVQDWGELEFGEILLSNFRCVGCHSEEHSSRNEKDQNAEIAPQEMLRLQKKGRYTDAKKKFQTKSAIF